MEPPGMNEWMVGGIQNRYGYTYISIFTLLPSIDLLHAYQNPDSRDRLGTP